MAPSPAASLFSIVHMAAKVKCWEYFEEDLENFEDIRTLSGNIVKIYLLAMSRKIR